MVTIKEKILKKIPNFVEKNKNMDDIIASIGNSFGGIETVNSQIRVAIDIMQATDENLDKKAQAFNMVRYWDETDEQLRQRILESIPFWQFAGSIYSIVENMRRADGVLDVEYINYDNHLHQQMSIIYTGAGTAATITIEDGILTTNCTGSPGDNVSYTLTNTSYDTLTEVMNALNGTGVYTAALVGSTTGDELSIWLQEQINIDRKNGNYNAINIQYTGDGSASTLTITGGVLTTSCTGAPGDNLSLNLTTYATLQQLVTAINATGKYTAEFLINGAVTSVTLIDVSAIDILTTSQILKLMTMVGGGFIMDLVVWYDGITYSEETELENINNILTKIGASNIEPHIFMIPDVITFIE